MSACLCVILRNDELLNDVSVRLYYEILYFKNEQSRHVVTYTLICVRVCVCVLPYFVITFFLFRQMYICHNIIIHLCLLMAKSMFSADFANKL